MCVCVCVCVCVYTQPTQPTIYIYIYIYIQMLSSRPFLDARSAAKSISKLLPEDLQKVTRKVDELVRSAVSGEEHAQVCVCVCVRARARLRVLSSLSLSLSRARSPSLSISLSLSCVCVSDCLCVHVRVHNTSLTSTLSHSRVRRWGSTTLTKYTKIIFTLTYTTTSHTAVGGTGVLLPGAY